MLSLFGNKFNLKWNDTGDENKPHQDIDPAWMYSVVKLQNPPTEKNVGVANSPQLSFFSSFFFVLNVKTLSTSFFSSPRSPAFLLWTNFFFLHVNSLLLGFCGRQTYETSFLHNAFFILFIGCIIVSFFASPPSSFFFFFWKSRFVVRFIKIKSFHLFASFI